MSRRRRRRLQEPPCDRHCHGHPEYDTEGNIFGHSNDDDDDIDVENENVLPACVSDADGAFGEAAAGAESQEQLVTFQYQVQTAVRQTATTLNGTVLKSLEKALSDTLVPDFFQGAACVASGRDLQLQQRSSETSLTETTLTGLRAAPADEILPGLDGIQCRTPLVAGAERCFIVQGVFTLIGSGDLSWAVPLSLIVTKDSMDQGLLNNVHPDVVDVAYVADGFGEDDVPGPSLEDPYDGTTTTRSNDGDDQIRANWPWAFLGLGVVAVVIVSIVFGRRRRRRGEELNESTILPEPLPTAGTISASDRSHWHEEEEVAATESRTDTSLGTNNDPFLRDDQELPSSSSLPQSPSDPLLREDDFLREGDFGSFSPFQDDDDDDDSHDGSGQFPPGMHVI